MRVTMQCGRNGSATHNEHRHIGVGDRDVVVRDMTGASAGTLRENELAYYARTFGPALEQRNERYRAQRHPERCKTIEQVYTSQKTRPEEVILQVGKREQTVDRETFESLVQVFFKAMNRWNRDHGAPFKTLDTVIHYDESTPHLHWRRVWQYEDKGCMRIGQTEALRRAGVPLPQPDQPEGRYNCRKMQFDAAVRDLWQRVCQAHDLEIETDPLPARRHEGTEEYIDRQITGKTEHLQELDQQVTALQSDVSEAHKSLSEAQEALNMTNMTLNASKRSLRRVEGFIERAKQVVSVVSPHMAAEVDKLAQEGRSLDRELNKNFDR